MPRLSLYCITHKRSDLSYEEQALLACSAGADAVQLRDDGLSDKEILRVGGRMKEICSEKGVLFILNNRPDLAFALDSDGVHVGENDIPVKWARQILGSYKIVGASVTSLVGALKAEKEGASYLGLGPIFETPIKSERPAIGLEAIALIKKMVKIPVIGIGGINSENAEKVILAGADGVSVIRAGCGAPDVVKAVRELKDKVSKAEIEKKGAGFFSVPAKKNS